MPRKKPNKSLQRFLIIVSTLAFFGSTAVFAIQGLFENSQHDRDMAENPPLSIEDQLRQQVRGYQLVLQREPNNSVALQGLIAAQNRLDLFLRQQLQQEPSNTEIQQQIIAANQESAQIYQELQTSYQQLLTKEPNNDVTLENLVAVRLQLRDARGAIEPLEKLVELYPDRDRYERTLNLVKQQIASEQEE
ncbi:MAG: hypothetical protein ACFBSE_27180 [Prochloraceae cyanobacterium]